MDSAMLLCFTIRCVGISHMDSGRLIGIVSSKVLAFTYRQWTIDRDHVFKSASFTYRQWTNYKDCVSKSACSEKR